MPKNLKLKAATCGKGYVRKAALAEAARVSRQTIKSAIANRGAYLNLPPSITIP